MDEAQWAQWEEQGRLGLVLDYLTEQATDMADELEAFSQLLVPMIVANNYCRHDRHLRINMMILLQVRIISSS